MRTATKLLYLNNPRFRTGAAHRRSLATKSARHATNINAAGTVMPVTPEDGIDSTRYSPDASMANSNADPATSNEAFTNPLSGGMILSASTAATRPIGTLMRKIQCHDASCVRIPPTAGPMAAPTDAPSHITAR